MFIRLSILYFLSFLYLCTATNCPNDCNKHGFCDNGKCICFLGYHDDNGEIEDCSRDVLQGKELPIYIILGLWQVVFGLSLLISGYSLYHFLQQERIITLHAQDTNGLQRLHGLRINNKGLVLLCVLLVSIFQLLISWDPIANRIWIHVVVDLFWGFAFSLQQIAYLSILFNWVELYYISVESLQKENMLRKINSNYNGKQITIEEMLEKALFLKKLRMPFVVIMIIQFGLQLVANITAGLYLLRPDNVNTIWLGYQTLQWLFMTCGFLIYGRKLADVVPSGVNRRFHKLTNRLTIFSTLAMIAVIAQTIIICLPQPHEALVFVVVVIVPLVVAIVNYGSLFMFVALKRKFPFIEVSSSDSDGNSIPLSSTISMEEVSQRI